MSAVSTPIEEIQAAPFASVAFPGPDFLSDCRLMLRFARKNGSDLHADLEHQIAQLDRVLAMHKLPPVSDVPISLFDDATGAMPPDPATTTELVLQVHRELSTVVAPATAVSLQTSEPPPGRTRLWGGMPLVVKLAMVMAGLSLVCLVATTTLLQAVAVH